MEIQQRLYKFVNFANWILLSIAALIGLFFMPSDFTAGIICGGLIVTINFHLLYRTLKKAFSPPHLASTRVILGKYYIRFIISGLIIFVLISEHFVDPLGLFVGLSVVVASIMIATIRELTKYIFKEAT
jgi:hypothetical protein